MTASDATQGSPSRRSALRELAASAGTILVKELRSRFRGRRAFIVLTLYLALLALIAYGAYAIEGPAARDAAQFGDLFSSGGTPNASARIGQAIFTALSLIQLLLVCFIAPAFTAGAISLEREKQTLELLIATPLRPAGLVVGKLVAALGFVLLMIVAGIPVSALVLMYGGASVDDILKQQAVLLASAIGFGVVGLFFSALTKRTQTATVLTYSTLLALTIGSLLVWRFWGAVATASPDNVFVQQRPGPEALLYLNPAVGMAEIVANTELEYGDFTDLIVRLRGGSPLVCEGDTCFRVHPSEPLAPRSDVDIDRRALAPSGLIVSNHFWPRVTVGLSAVAVILTLAAMRLISPTGIRPGPMRRRGRARPAADPPLEEAIG